MWNAGDLPRWSNANGLTGNLYATGSDDSGWAAGTQIGADFGLWKQGNLTAPYGSLVGQIGSGNYFLIGTNYSGIAGAAGLLNLYYWDSNNGDNSQFVTASVNAVPLPAALPLMISGLAGLGFLGAKKRKSLSK